VAKYQKEGSKPRRGGNILKIQYWMYAATGGPNVKWGAPISNGGFQAPLPPAGDGPALSQKYFSPTLITSMSSVIHHILVKIPTKSMRFC